LRATIRILFVLLCACCGDSRDSEPDIAFQAESVALNETKPLIRFGVISAYNPVLMYEEYQPLMGYLTSHTPYAFELKLGKTYEEVVRFLGEGDIEVASLGPVTYLEAHVRYGAVPILRSLNAEGEPHYRSIIIVRSDSDIDSLPDLDGRSFCFPSPHSTSGNLFGRFILEESGVHLQNLSRYINLRHHDEVAKAVLAGQFDAGAVKDLVAYRYKSKGLRFLHVSDPIPSVPIVVRRDAPPALVQAVVEALLRLSPANPDYQLTMAGWGEEVRNGFIEAADKDYEPIRAMLNSVPDRCGGSCHPPLRF
jgi:phosphonate transport system substrate-binding protein